MPNNDSHQHVVKTSAQWNERAIEYWVVPRGCLCVELTPRGKTKIKVGEGDKNYYQLPYIFDHDILLNYYTKEEVDNLFNNLNRMAIMSTDEYDSRSDLPHVGNKLGDVRFVKSASPSIKIDPDMYVWNSTKWVFVGNPMVDLTPYVTKEEFNVVKDKVDEIYPKAHTHDNKELLDNITQADRDKFDDLHNYDDTEIRDLINRSVHTHPNKDLLDTIMGYSILSYSDRVKLDNLHNYDDTEVKVRLVAVEEKAHVHRNKAVLDGITQEKLDEIDELAATYTIVRNDITDLKSKSHVHPNKDILDGTTAAYTVDQQRELQRVSNIDIFIGAGPTWNGVFGYVPAPEAGQQTYFLRADGTWAKVKSGGDKYKAGEGIYILSGETTSDSFPFKVYSRAGHLSQYIIYGNTGGVGDAMVGGMYGVNITVTDEHGNASNTSIILPEKISLGDYIDYGKQVFVHMRTNVSSLLGNIDPGYAHRWAIYPDGSIQSANLGAFGDKPQVTSLVELEPGVTYELYHQCAYTEFTNYMNLNVYDTGQNRTRTINFYDPVGNVPTIIALASNEKYIRLTYSPLPTYYTYTLIRVKAVETPITLPQIPLFPNSINTINITNTIKPAEIYVEVAEPSEDDPDDPMSDFTGIIYNDGVLDITQEDPTALNELTVHFRDNVDKTITIPATPLEPATTTTLGGIIVGDNLTIDENGVLSAEAGGADYVSGDGIDIRDAAENLIQYVRFEISAIRDASLAVVQFADILLYDDQNTVLPIASGTCTFSDGSVPQYGQHDGYYYWSVEDSFDNNYDTKLCVTNWSSYKQMRVDYRLATPINKLRFKSYKWVTANDADGRDPVSWSFYTSTDGTTWTLLDQHTGYSTTTSRKTPTEEFELDFGPVQDRKTVNVIPATTTTIGGVIVGDGLSVDGTGEISVDEMTGADGTNAGTSGTVPAPTATDNTKFLRGDGTWVEINNANYVSGQGVNISAAASSEYTQVEYLKSNGTQCIRTDIISNVTDTTILDLKFGSMLNDGSNVQSHQLHMFGASRYFNKFAYWASAGQVSAEFYLGYGWSESLTGHVINSPDNITTRQLMTIRRGNTTYGNKSCSADAAVASTPTRPLSLFGYSYNDSVTTPYVGYELYLYEVKIIDSTNVLIHDLIPVKRNADDEPGMYDLKTNKFYTNAGTGVFTLGSDVGPVPSDDQVISAKIGSGLHFDSNGAIAADVSALTASHGVEIVSDDIEANLGAGLVLDQNDAITLDESTKFTLYCNNDSD